MSLLLSSLERKGKKEKEKKEKGKKEKDLWVVAVQFLPLQTVFSLIFLSLPVSLFSRKNEGKKIFSSIWKERSEGERESEKRERKERKIGKKKKRKENEIFFRVKYFGDFPLAPNVYFFYRNQLL